MSSQSFEELVEQAVRAEFRGWEFGWLAGRASGGDPVGWSYDREAGSHLKRARSVLDIDTGGGELLAALAPLPPRAIAVEGWLPNLAIARDRLEPLGVDVRAIPHDARLPVDDGEVDLVLNRHGRMPTAQIARVLVPGGRFLGQQVGSRNSLDLNEALGALPATAPDTHTLDTTVASLREAGLVVERAAEEFPEHAFFDIGAVVYQLLAVPWQIPGFDPWSYEPALRRLDERIRADGRVVFHDHRFLVEARRP